ncbi:MAG: hypothetical protein ACOCT9_00065 [archaeon]
MGLNKEEIKQLHNNFIVLREHKILDKIPFVIKSYTWGEEKDFVKMFDEFEPGDSNLYVQNKIVEQTLKHTLVSYDNEKMNPKKIENFSPEKINYIFEKYKELSEDVESYLEEFGEKDLTDEEIEEYILTDKITRNITLKHEEDIRPLKFSYRILNLKENKEIGKKVKERINEEDIKTKLASDYINEDLYAQSMINSINGHKINKNNIYKIGVEIIKFILNRAGKVENQMNKILKNPKKMGENLKN